MWEFARLPSHRYTSMRKIFIYSMAAIAAAFLWALVFTSNTFAIDASWSNKTAISYESNVYLGPVNETDNVKLGLPKGAKAYTYTDPTLVNSSSTDPQKIHIIYFTPDVDVSAATSAKYKTFLYNGPGDFSSPSSPVDIVIGLQSAAPDPGTSSCVVDGGLGWIICPITNFIANGMDHIFGILSNFLTVRPVGTNSDSALFRAWTYMRSFANVAFVAAFLIIIYSQLTNLGISNYGIKKLLPRLIVAALLVNLSYYICAIAVDISNILGHSLQDVFISMRNSLVGSEGNNWNTISFSSISSFILSGGTLATAGAVGLGFTLMNYGIAGSLFLLLPTLMAGLVAVLIALLIMAARQAIVTILIILSPLAFVAYLLPNTEKWFEKWQSTFVTMLILFPAFSIVFGGSQLAAAAIIQNADSINLIILGMVIQVVPLFVTPLLINMSGSILGKVAGIVNNPNKGLIDRTRKFTDDRAQNIMAKRLGAKAQNGEFLKRGAQYMDHRRRKREGLRSARTGMTDARWANSRDYSNIDQMSREASSSKSLGEGRSELRYNSQKNVTGSHIQNLDMRLRENKQQLDNTNARTENIFKASPNYKSLHEDAYKLGISKTTIEQTLERDLSRKISVTPELLRKEMKSRLTTNEATYEKELINRVEQEIKAGIDTSTTGALSALAAHSELVTRNISINGLAIESAKRVQQQNFEKALAPTLEKGKIVVTDAARLAAGIDSKHGSERIQALVKSMEDKRDNEDVTAMITLMNSSTSAERKINDANNWLREARSEGDIVKGFAATKLLMSTGMAGKLKLDKIIREIPAGDDSLFVNELKGFLLSNGIKESNVAIDKWAINEDKLSLDTVANTLSTYQGVNLEDLAGQANHLLRAALNAGYIDSKSAGELLSNPNSAKRLTKEQRSFFEAVRDNSPIPPSSKTAP